MLPLELYYLNQAGSGPTTPGILPVYSTPLYVQRGHVIGNFFGILFRWFRSFLWRGAEAVVREMLRTGGKILSESARVSKRVLRACRAAQISGFSKRILDVRGAAHPLRGQHDAHEGGASYSEQFQVVENRI